MRMFERIMTRTTLIRGPAGSTAALSFIFVTFYLQLLVVVVYNMSLSLILAKGAVKV